MSTASPKQGLTSVQWLICIIASIGFAFDIYELLMAPLVFPDAIRDLTGASPTDPATRSLFLSWAAWLFFVPAFVGGLVGMVGGYLTDIWGRRRVLDVFDYSICGFSVSRGLQHEHLDAAGLSLHDVHRRVRRVRGGSGMARGTLR